MPIEPKIPKKAFLTKTCAKCGITTSTDDFAQTHSIFYPDGRLPICNSCANAYLRDNSYSWDSIDALCRWADIPWIVKEWERLVDLNGIEKTWPVYSKVFAADCYKSLGWADYHRQYKALREAGAIDEEIPLLHEEKMKGLRRRWGSNYDDEDLYYLEDLYQGLVQTQNINGALQIDQAQKICKLSLEIDSKIRAGDKDVDKFMSSYDKLVKTAEFTPKNTKNAIDFDSFGEVCFWLEKRGKQNQFYDDVTRDVIDETLKNIEAYNQRLYVNEGGLGDEINQRLKALQSADAIEKQEQVFDIEPEFDLDEYENAGFTAAEDFDPTGGDDDDE